MKDDIRGHLILIMAPSGSGKGLLINHIKQTVPDVHFAISCTTRDPRPGERDGEAYYFISKDEFTQRIKDDQFLEWAEFSGNCYGTLKSEILDPLRAGKIVLREVELQGILAIRELIPDEHRTIVYIDAGPWEILERRIIARAPMSDEHLRLREERYLEESKWKAFADVVIENNEGRLDDAKKELQKFIEQRLATITTNP